MIPYDISLAFTEALKLDKHKLCGIYFSDEKPSNALELKKKGSGCIVPPYSESNYWNPSGICRRIDRMALLSLLPGLSGYHF